MREGEVTEGITGVFPTVTWSSHTSIITGVAPAEHGILSNRRPRSEGGDYYSGRLHCSGPRRSGRRRELRG
jgi:predicted AlkP superfamily pyrophosphatase or phosphodiesterase